MADEQQPVTAADWQSAKPVGQSDWDSAKAVPGTTTTPKTDTAAPAGHTPETWASKLEDIGLAATGPLGLLFTRAAKPIRDYISEHPASAAANAAGIVADFASEGATLPLHMAIVGGSGAVAGAGTQAASDVVQGKPLGRDVLTAGAEGAAQGLAPAAGAVIGAGARGVMRVAQGARAALMDEFPGLSQYAIDNAIAISQGGLDKARQILRGAKQAASAVIGQAQSKGVKIPVSAATDGLMDTLDTAAKGADIVGDTNALAKLETQIKAGRPADLDPQEADALLRDLQKNAQQAYKASLVPGAAPNLSIQAQGYKDAARNLRQAMGQTFDQAGAPGFLDANAEAQQAIGTVRATRAATAKNTYAAIMTRAGLGSVVGYEQGGAKGAAEGAVAGMALTPGMLSRLAIVLGNPATKLALSRLPPAVASQTIHAFLNKGSQ